MRNALKRFVQVADKGLSRLLVGLLAVMVAVVSWQVATRYLLDSPSSVTEELATYLLIWISLLGAVHALRQGAHIGVDILERRVQGRRKRIVQGVTHAVVLIFALAVLVYGGARLVYVTLALDQVSAALQIPMGYVYSVIPLSGLLMAVYALEGLVSGEEAAPDARPESSADDAAHAAESMTATEREVSS